MSTRLSKQIHAVCFDVNDHADLIALAARLVRQKACTADDGAYPALHEACLVLECAEMRLRDTADLLDILSSKCGPEREAAQ